MVCFKIQSSRDIVLVNKVSAIVNHSITNLVAGINVASRSTCSLCRSFYEGVEFERKPDRRPAPLKIVWRTRGTDSMHTGVKAISFASK